MLSLDLGIVTSREEVALRVIKFQEIPQGPRLDQLVYVLVSKGHGHGWKACKIDKSIRWKPREEPAIAPMKFCECFFKKREPDFVFQIIMRKNRCALRVARYQVINYYLFPFTTKA